MRAIREREVGAKGIPFSAVLGAGAFVVTIAAIALGTGGSWLPLYAQIPLVALTLGPWIPRLTQRWLSWRFVLLSTVPTLLFTWSGGSPILFAVLALSASRVATVGTVRRSFGYSLVAMFIVGGRQLIAGVPTDWIVWTTYVELGLALGYAMRSQRLLLHRTRAARDEHARLAALEERRRIARDVHDVLAHTLTILMVHVNSARLSVHDDPDATAEVLDEVAQYGRRCLEEIRRTVGLLSEPPSAVAQELIGAIESAEAIEELVESYRKAGIDVDLRLDVEMAQMGLLAQASPAVWVTSHRIVRESLANATKHASGSAVHVRIGVDDACLNVVCSNDLGSGAVVLELPKGGNGITGMCERVAGVGGTITAGPEGKSWVVRAELPLTKSGADARRATSLGRAS